VVDPERQASRRDMRRGGPGLTEHQVMLPVSYSSATAQLLAILVHPALHLAISFTTADTNR
jgi:hypothetical protein